MKKNNKNRDSKPKRKVLWHPKRSKTMTRSMAKKIVKEVVQERGSQ